MAGKMVEFPEQRAHREGLSGHPRLRQGPGRARDPGVVGPGAATSRTSCDRFAAAGFSALAPDLYHGQTATEPDAAGKLFMALNIERAEKDLRRGRQVPRRPLLDRQARRGGLLHGRPARPLRGLHQPDVGRGGGLLRHPSEREAGLRQAERSGARALRREGRLRDAADRPRGGGRHQEGGQARSRSTSIRAWTTASSTTSGPTSTTRPAAEDAWRRTLDLFKKHLK